MRSEAEIREAIETAMRVGLMAYQRKDEEFLLSVVTVKGVLAWALGEESGFDELLKVWRS